MSVNSLGEILAFYKAFKGKRFDDVAIAFVFNNISSEIDKTHHSECLTEAEYMSIYNAFRLITEHCFMFSSESSFIDKHKQFLHSYKKVYVYSMAQNNSGICRRALVPLLCEYYKYCNLNADAWTSALGGNKKAMFKLLKESSVKMPITHFVENYSSVISAIEDFTHNNIIDIVVKPNSESASIGVQFLKVNQSDLLAILCDAIDEHKCIMLQEYIYGDEIEIPVFKHADNYFSFPPVQIIYKGNDKHLTYETVLYENYGFEQYVSNLAIDDLTVALAKSLNFTGISRFDFRVTQANEPYLIDITPNPTISEFSSVNYIVRGILNDDASAIFKLLAYEKLSLLKPSFDASP